MPHQKNSLPNDSLPRGQGDGAARAFSPLQAENCPWHRLRRNDRQRGNGRGGSRSLWLGLAGLPGVEAAGAACLRVAVCQSSPARLLLCALHKKRSDDLLQELWIGKSKGIGIHRSGCSLFSEASLESGIENSPSQQSSSFAGPMAVGDSPAPVLQSLWRRSVLRDADLPGLLFCSDKTRHFRRRTWASL